MLRAVLMGSSAVFNRRKIVFIFPVLNFCFIAAVSEVIKRKDLSYQEMQLLNVKSKFLCSHCRAFCNILPLFPWNMSTLLLLG